MKSNRILSARRPEAALLALSRRGNFGGADLPHPHIVEVIARNACQAIDKAEITLGASSSMNDDLEIYYNRIMVRDSIARCAYELDIASLQSVRTAVYQAALSIDTGAKITIEQLQELRHMIVSTANNEIKRLSYERGMLTF